MKAVGFRILRLLPFISFLGCETPDLYGIISLLETTAVLISEGCRRGDGMMISLRPYKACDAQNIVKWLKDEYAFRQWSADRYLNYPITAQDMNDYYDRDKENGDIWGMTAFDESGVIGHFTMRFTDDKKKIIRLGFVIIDDKKRRQGYGREMLRLASRFAFDFVHADKITLGVFENNFAAIRCYESAGFQPVVLDKTECYQCLGETWKCIEMEKTRRV